MIQVGKAAFRPKIADYFSKSGELIALVMIVIIASFTYKEFFTLTNISNIFRQVSMIGLMSLGMTLVIVSGGIDLSVGSIVALSAIAASYFSQNILWAIAAPLGIGVLCGAVNGLIITRLSIVPFIATLATQMAIRGIAYILTGIKTVPVSSDAAAFTFIGQGYLGWLPVPVAIFLAASLVMVVVAGRTGFGRSIYAIGGNEDAARMIGLKVDRNKMLCYVIMGFFAALAGIILGSRLGAGQPVSGRGWEMNVIAAVAIGGTLLTGGVGSIAKTVVGVVILGIINNIINLQGTLNSYWQSIITGAILLAIIIIQNVTLRKRSLRGACE